MDSYRVGNSPHIRHEDTVSSIMLDVIFALTAPLVWGIYVFGWRALTVTLLSVISAVLFEALYEKITHRPNTVRDLSAVVTGLLLAMNLPVSVPLWLPVLGSFFAIVVVKQLFGGLGKNFVNPVLASRAFLFVSFPAYMCRFTEPFSVLNPFSVSLREESLVDAVSSATPLKELKGGSLPQSATVFDLLTGKYAGCIGEVSALLLLIGGIYLLTKKVISWHIPVSFLGTIALLTFLFPQAGTRFEFMTASLLSGGVILGAVFMATDFVTSPVTGGGKLVYGVLCGALTVFIRYFGGYSEGASFAILMANLLVWYLDQLFMPRPYGTKKEKAPKPTEKTEAKA